jgi:hypothetical protein
VKHGRLEAPRKAWIEPKIVKNHQSPTVAEGEEMLATAAIPASGQHPRSIRDTGPYSTRNLAKGASITDAAQVFTALRDGLTVGQVRDAARSGKVLS